MVSFVVFLFFVGGLKKVLVWGERSGCWVSVFFCFGLVWRWSSDVFLCWDTLQLAAYKGMPTPWKLQWHWKMTIFIWTYEVCLSNQSCLFSGVYCFFFQIFFQFASIPVITESSFRCISWDPPRWHLVAVTEWKNWSPMQITFAHQSTAVFPIFCLGRWSFFFLKQGFIYIPGGVDGFLPSTVFF